jgi:hypothetical protein
MSFFGRIYKQAAQRRAARAQRIAAMRTQRLAAETSVTQGCISIINLSNAIMFHPPTKAGSVDGQGLFVLDRCQLVPRVEIDPHTANDVSPDGINAKLNGSPFATQVQDSADYPTTSYKNMFERGTNMISEDAVPILANDIIQLASQNPDNWDKIQRIYERQEDRRPKSDYVPNVLSCFAMLDETEILTQALCSRDVQTCMLDELKTYPDYADIDQFEEARAIIEGNEEFLHEEGDDRGLVFYGFGHIFMLMATIALLDKETLKPTNVATNETEGSDKATSMQDDETADADPNKLDGRGKIAKLLNMLEDYNGPDEFKKDQYKKLVSQFNAFLANGLPGYMHKSDKTARFLA